jgi:hypothetical protein
MAISVDSMDVRFLAPESRSSTNLSLCPALEARQERVGDNNPRGTDPINQFGDIRECEES